MELIRIEVTGNIARVTERPSRITSGTVGLPIVFTFDDQWAGLNKTAVFRGSGITKIVERLESETIVPWEVLKKPNTYLHVGVYGANSDGTVAIPTIWANVHGICKGVNPDGDPSTDPGLPIYQVLLNDMGNPADLETEANRNLVEAINEVHNIAYSGGIITDKTLTADGKAADAKATGDAIRNLTAKDVGARPDDWLPTPSDIGAKPDTWAPTAEDVGARSDTWMPTAEEVGARPVDWTPTAKEVGARPDTWMPTASDVGARPDTWIPTASEVGARPSDWTPNAEEVKARPDTWLPSLAEIGAQAQHRNASVTLLARDWINNKQTVAVDVVTNSNTIIPSPDPAYYDLYAENGVIATEQADGSVTFQCESVPDADIIVNLAIFAEGNGSATGGGDGPAITDIAVTESADGSVTMVNTLVGGGTETIVISPDANGNPSKLTYNGTEIPITWTEATATEETEVTTE